jgi:hypothetical protein
MIDSKRAYQESAMLFRLAYYTAQGVSYIPRKILQTGVFMFNSVLPDEITRSRANMPTKVRPPRFVSFTMELEPYSKKKAFALEILNDINLNVFETETIQKLYTMNAHVVIITGKRVICVDEHRPDVASFPAREKVGTSQKIISGLDKLLPGGVHRNLTQMDFDAEQNQMDH